MAIAPNTALNSGALKKMIAGLPIIDVGEDGKPVEVIAPTNKVAAANEVIQKVAVDVDWVELRLVQIVDRCMQAEPVTDREGKPTGVYTFNAGGALRALELLGKQRGMFVDRKEVRSGPLEEVTDDRLRELLARYAAAAGVSLPAVGGGAQGTNEPA